MNVIHCHCLAKGCLLRQSAQPATKKTNTKQIIFVCHFSSPFSFSFLCVPRVRHYLVSCSPLFVCIGVHLLLCGKRLRRLVFSDKFYILYGGVGWGGMGSGGVERVEEKRWVNKPHPRLPDPDDRRGDQLRRRQVCANTHTQHTTYNTTPHNKHSVQHPHTTHTHERFHGGNFMEATGLFHGPDHFPITSNPTLTLGPWEAPALKTQGVS